MHRTLLVTIAVFSLLTSCRGDQRGDGPAGTCDEWFVTAELQTPRARHTATLLNGGRIFVAGGMQLDEAGRVAKPLSSTELVDPETGEVQTGPELPATMYDHHAWRLPSGDVGLIGGTIDSDEFVALRYDPATNEIEHWTPQGISYHGNDVSEFSEIADGRTAALALNYLLVFDVAADEAGVEIRLPTSTSSMEVAGNTVWVAGYDHTNNVVALFKWDSEGAPDSGFTEITGPPFTPDADEFSLTISRAEGGFVVSVGTEGLFYYDPEGDAWEVLEGDGIFAELRGAHTIGSRVFFDGLPAPRVLSPSRTWEPTLPNPTARRAHATVIDGLAVHRVGGIDSTDWSKAKLVGHVESCP